MGAERPIACCHTWHSQISGGSQRSSGVTPWPSQSYLTHFQTFLGKP